MKERIESLMEQAREIDRIKIVATQMRDSAKADMHLETRKALMIGYADLLMDVFHKTQYMWLHLYQLKEETEKEENASE